MAARRHAAVGVTDSIPGWALSVLDSYTADLPPPKSSRTSHVAASAVGWPLLCIKAVIVDVPGSAGKPFRGMIHVGRKVGLPFLPIWGGLLVNAIIFSPVPFALHWTWRAWVRHVRRTSGECPECGYDRKGLAGEAPCPECGATPTIPATRAT